MTNNLLPIAKEGWNYIVYTLGFFLLTLVFDFEFLSLISFIFLLFLGYSFRNPERELPRFEEKSALSPVDGVVVLIEELDDFEYFYKIIINSGYNDVSILRSPMSAKVQSIYKLNGTRLCLNNSLGHKLNENIDIVFKDQYENRIKVKHIVKQSFCGLKIDEINTSEMLQSSRYGVMMSGISELYLPKNFRLNISQGDDVKASQTLLGYFS